MAKSNGKLAEIPSKIQTAIALRLELRDWLEKAEEEYKAKVAPKIEYANQIDGILLDFLDSSGIESARTNQGTVYVQERDYAQVSDPEAFVQCVRETEMLELFQVRASAPACREFVKEHNALPPGVSFNTVRSAIIRRA